MGSHMPFQVTLQCKRTRTHGTLEWFLSSVNPNVSHVDKSNPQLKGFLATLASHMFSQV
jgi:hypothetical protein